MNPSDNRVTIRVWGDYACFTRPEMKVERVSYPICTPSAARGILEAIFWEPQMYYVIDSVAVVKKGRWFSFRRNEVTKVVSIKEAQSWMQGEPVKYVQAGGGAVDAAQRNMLALADVEYLIVAEVRPSRLHNPVQHDIRKYLEEIKRRASNGKCYHRPALGCREFAADFDWVDDPKTIARTQWPEEDLGLMLYDVFDVNDRAHGFRWLSNEKIEQARQKRETEIAQLPKAKRKEATKEPLPTYEGILIRPQALFFHARIKGAVMDCHPARVQIIRPKTKEAV